jgi:GNAT superfamily N-acetyltransferase
MLTPGSRIEVRPTAPDELAEPLLLLEEFSRNGEPVPPLLTKQLARAIALGNLEVLAARVKPGGSHVGVAVLAFRPSVSVGATFASIEDLYVRPEERRQGVGRALLEAVAERCRVRGVSYVEVQTDEAAAPFYEALGYEPEPGVRVLSDSYAL